MKKFKICKLCNKSLLNTREYFQRTKIKGKESLTDICRDCIKYNRISDDWKDGKLK